MRGTWGSAADLVHFLDIEALRFVGLVDAKDPEGGPYTRYAAIPSEGVERAITNGHERVSDLDGPRDGASGLPPRR